MHILFYENPISELDYTVLQTILSYTFHLAENSKFPVYKTLSILAYTFYIAEICNFRNFLCMKLVHFCPTHFIQQKCVISLNLNFLCRRKLVLHSILSYTFYIAEICNFRNFLCMKLVHFWQKCVVGNLCFRPVPTNTTHCFEYHYNEKYW